MIALITAGLQFIANLSRDRAEIKTLELNSQKEEIKQRTKLIQSDKDYNHAWELAALGADRLSALRKASFLIYTGLLLLPLIAPNYAIVVWVSLNTVPDWIIGVQMTMVALIWSAKPIANVGAGIIQKAKGKQ